MKLASYICETYRRPELLKLCVSYLQRSIVPDGWELEIVLSAHESEARDIRLVQSPWPVRVYPSTDHRIGPQFNNLLEHARGDLLLRTGDDDLHAPDRLPRAIAAWEAGHWAAGFRPFHFFHASTGEVVRWEGPAQCAGTTMSYDGDVLRSVRVDPVDRNGDSALCRAFAATGRDPEDVFEFEAPFCVAIDHGANVSGRRPCPRERQKVKHGAFMLTGLGAVESQDWDRSVVEDLRRVTRMLDA